MVKVYYDILYKLSFTTADKRFKEILNICIFSSCDVRGTAHGACYFIRDKNTIEP